MKKILLIIIGLALAMPAWAAQTPVAQISGTKPSIGSLKDDTNTRLGTIESNRQDHETRVAAMETGKADKTSFMSQAAFTSAWGWAPGGGSFDQAGNYTLTGSWDFSGATVTGVSGAALPTWMPSVGPTNGRQILQAVGGCSNTAHDTQTTCEANGGTWTTPTYQHTSVISGLINNAGTADDDLWSAVKIISELATKQVALSVPDQAEATSGTSSIPRAWTAQRVAQAIAALAPSSSAGEGYYEIDGGSSTSITFTGDIDGGASL